MLRLRGPQYLMGEELDEIRAILLASEAEVGPNDWKSKAKELRSRAVLMPILMLILMFSFQVIFHSSQLKN